MERWAGRVAVVTGTSSGIGAAIAEELVKKGLKVVGLARRVERVEELAKSLKSEKGKLHPLKCDIRKESEIKEAFQWVKKNHGGVDILINNAGFFSSCPLIDGSSKEWKTILETNVLGLSICTKEALKIMKENGVDDGHIVHMNSDGGHKLPGDILYVMYFASHHAITVLTEGLRRELIKQNSKIRVTSLNPGLVRTDMAPKELLDKAPSLDPKDVADACLYILGTPPHVQVHDLTLLPLGQAL